MGMALYSGIKVLAPKTDAVEGENQFPQVVLDLYLKVRAEGCHTLSLTHTE